MALLENRKFFAFLISAILVQVLKALGIAPNEVQALYGVSFGDIQMFLLDGLMQGVLPAFVGWVWPNDPDAGILDYWKVALAGVVFIGAVALVIAVL